MLCSEDQLQRYFIEGRGRGGGGGDVVIDVIMYAETRAAIVHFDF